MERSELIASRAFLGNEFLTWIWFRSETAEARIETADGAVAVWIDDRMSLETFEGDAQEDRFTGGSPSRSPEARVALQQGKKVSTARLHVGRGERDWTCTIKGRTLDTASIKIPAIMSKADDDKFYDRMALVEELFAILDGLYRAFLDVRLGGGWAAELKAMQGWSERPAQG